MVFFFFWCHTLLTLFCFQHGDNSDLFIFLFSFVCEHRWVHVLCAITVLEARFVNITERSPIDLSAIPLPRFRLVRLAFLLYLLHSRLVYLLTYSSNSLPNCGLRSGCTDVTAAVWSSLQVPHVGYIFMLNHCWFLLEVLLNVIWLRWSQCVVFATVIRFQFSV